MSLKEEIQHLESQLLEPSIRSSTEELDKLIHSEFLEIGSMGKVYNKSQVIRALTLNKDEVTFELSHFEISELADGVVLATFGITKNGPNGESLKSLRSSIWKKENDQFKIYFHQSTLRPF